MPKMTNANRALMAHERIARVLKDTKERVHLPLRRQMGPRDKHTQTLGALLAQVEALLPEFDSWAREEATRADIEHDERVEVRKEEYAARRKERTNREWSARNLARAKLRASKDRPTR